MFIFFFLLKKEEIACPASLPRAVLYISKDKLLGYTTVLVKIQEQVEGEVNDSYPQGKKKITCDPDSQRHKETHWTTEISSALPSTYKWKLILATCLLVQCCYKM